MSPRLGYRAQLAVFVSLAVSGWLGFLLLFQALFPVDYDPSRSHAPLLAWVTAGTVGLLGVMVVSFRVLRTPRAWMPSMAIGGIAPALCLDAVATTFYRDWFTSSGPYEAQAYAATIIGGSAVLLLAGLVLARDLTAGAEGETDVSR